MKRIIIIAIILLTSLLVQGKTVQEWLNSALEAETNSVKEAIKIMGKAEAEYPQDPDILSMYGLMLSKRAGEVNFLKAGGFASRAEKEHDKALSLNPNHKNARLWRGILKVNMPKFLGKLEGGVEDLTNISRRDDLEAEEIMVVNFYLGMGYQKADNKQAARDAYQNILRSGANAPFYHESLVELMKLTGLTENELLENKD